MPGDAPLVVVAGSAYVSRGGQKLANALDALGIDPAGRRALDVGASTGGFTDCLLQRGAAQWWRSTSPTASSTRASATIRARRCSNG